MLVLIVIYGALKAFQKRTLVLIVHQRVQTFSHLLDFKSATCHSSVIYVHTKDHSLVIMRTTKRCSVCYQFRINIHEGKSDPLLRSPGITFKLSGKYFASYERARRKVNTPWKNFKGATYPPLEYKRQHLAYTPKAPVPYTFPAVIFSNQPTNIGAFSLNYAP